VAFCFHWSERWEDRAIFLHLKTLGNIGCFSASNRLKNPGNEMGIQPQQVPNWGHNNALSFLRIPFTDGLHHGSSDMDHFRLSRVRGQILNVPLLCF
jgi:hypothetical protein